VEAAEAARARGDDVPAFPERAVVRVLDNTWGDSGKAFFNNWLGWVYRVTHLDRHELFMEGVDPRNPLNMKLSG
jgi:homoserine O-succinyltransferase